MSSDGLVVDVKKKAIPQWFIFFSLFVLAILAFSNSFPGSFIGDDLSIVKNNPLVANIDLKAIFTSDYWGRDANSGLFRPLTILSFAINRLLLGPSPAAFHAVNVLLHGLVTVMLYLVLRRQAVFARIAWFAAALFAVHPIHTEVVNEAVGRAELLAALGVFSALWCCGLKRGAGAWLLAGIAYLLALLSKEHAVVLLPTLMLLDRVSGRWQGGRWREVVPLYGLLGAISGLWLVWRAWGVVRFLPPDARDVIYTPLASLPTGDRVASALAIQWDYLWTLLSPFKLQGIYSGETFFQPVILTSLMGMATVVATLSLLGWAARSWSRSCPGGTVVLAYTLAFLPASNLFFATGVTLAERLAYLPSAWFCAALAVLCRWLSERLAWRRVFNGAVVAILAVYLAATLARNPAFATPQNLWQANVETDSKNVLAWMYLANTYADLDRIEEADEAYRAMLELAPDFTEGLRNYAQFLLTQKRYQEAVVLALKVANSPRSWSPHNAMVLAQAYYFLGDPAEALRWLESARPLFQDYAIFWEYLGRIQEVLGDRPGAIASYRRGLASPEATEIPLRLGNLLLQSGQHREAQVVFKSLVEQNPKSAAGWNGLGVSSALLGEQQQAEEAFARAVTLDPQNLNYLDNLRRLSGPE